MDPQLVELIGRSLLQSQLLSDEIEVALPIRDRGIDLIAYLDRGDDSQLHSCFLQMKAASKKAFGIDTKYKKISHFKFVYVWHVHEVDQARFFLMSYSEAESLCKNYSWTPYGNGLQKWSTTNPSKDFTEALTRFEVFSGQWRQKLFNVKKVPR